MYEIGKPIFKKSSGSVIIFDGLDKDKMPLAHIKDFKGEEFQVMYLDSILARGYWEEIINTESDE
jgi:hypothetical protein